MAAKHILVVDDEIGIRELLRDILQDEGYQVRLAENAAQARDLRKQQRPDLVLLDIWMPDCDGISLLKEWGNSGQLTMPVIMMSGHGTIDTAVEATRIGAFGFLEKPIALQKLLQTIGGALKHAEQLPKPEIDINLTSLGKSIVINDLKLRLEQISIGSTPILLIGGKGDATELCAQFLHTPHTPWIKLNEHEKLATEPLAILEQAREGILYLPEVAALNNAEQKGLMLLLAKAEKYDVRVICATTSALVQLSEQGLFETSLLQTLLSSSLRVPALQDHREDIPDLANAMAMLLAESTDTAYKAFDVSALNGLRNANWPGDLVQLETVVRNLLHTSLGVKITLDDVQRVLGQFAEMGALSNNNGSIFTSNSPNTDSAESINSTPSSAVSLGQPLREARDDFERVYFKHHLASVNYHMSKLADISGLERTHLYRKLKQLGINVKGQ